MFTLIGGGVCSSGKLSPAVVVFCVIVNRHRCPSRRRAAPADRSRLPLKGHEEPWYQREVARAALDRWLPARGAFRSRRRRYQTVPPAPLRHAVVVIRPQKDGVATISDWRGPNSRAHLQDFSGTVCPVSWASTSMNGSLLAGMTPEGRSSLFAKREVLHIRSTVQADTINTLV